MLNPQSKYYGQVQSLRDLTGSSFSNGQIRFNWTIPPEESWNPYQSYFRIRSSWAGYSRKYKESSSTADTTHTDIHLIDGIAPSQYFNDQFWQQIEMRINGVCINKQDNYCGQIAALRHRMRPSDWNRTYGDINFHSDDFNKRARRIAVDGHLKQEPCSSGWVDFSDLINTNDVADGFLNFVVQDTGAVTTEVALIRSAANFAWDTIGEPYQIKVGDIIMVRTKYSVTATNYQWLKITVTAVAAASVTGDLGSTSENTSQTNAFTMDLKYPGALFVQRKCAGIYNSYPVKKLETCWRPQLGFFQINEWLPGGEYEICLTPYPSGSLQQNIIEAKQNNVVSVDFEIISMDFTIAKAKYSSTKNSIKFEEIRCQAKTLNTTSLTQKQYVINAKTKAITLAFQDNRVSNRFDIPQVKFTVVDDTGNAINPNWEQNLTRYYIQYDGMVLPNPIPSIQRTGTDDFIAQQWWETTYSKMLLFDEIETFEEWKERGMYFHYNWPRQSETATEIQISQEFSGSLPSGSLGELRPQILLFEHTIKEFSFELFQNYITKVIRRY